jgi:hypothetical protein
LQLLLAALGTSCACVALFEDSHCLLVKYMLGIRIQISKVAFASLLLQVLLGPFVDVEQPLISGGMINVTFQQLFQTQVGT